GRRRAVLVVRGAIGFDGALVVPDRLDQLALDVREDTEVPLDARQQLTGLPAALERLEEMGAGFLQGAGAQGEPTHRVQRFGGKHVVAERARDFVAAVTQIARPRGLVAMMEHNRETPQCLRENRLLAGPLGGGNGCLVTADCLRNARGSFLAPRFVQQIRGGAVYHATT